MQALYLMELWDAQGFACHPGSLIVHLMLLQG